MADVRLEFGVQKDVSEANIKGDLAGIINSLPVYKIKIGVDKGTSNNKIDSYLNKKFGASKGYQVTIGKVALSSGAISSLKSQIKQAFNTPIEVSPKFNVNGATFKASFARAGKDAGKLFGTNMESEVKRISAGSRSSNMRKTESLAKEIEKNYSYLKGSNLSNNQTYLMDAQRKNYTESLRTIQAMKQVGTYTDAEVKKLSHLRDVSNQIVKRVGEIGQDNLAKLDQSLAPATKQIESITAALAVTKQMKRGDMSEGLIGDINKLSDGANKLKGFIQQAKSAGEVSQSLSNDINKTIESTNKIMSGLGANMTSSQYSKDIQTRFDGIKSMYESLRQLSSEKFLSGNVFDNFEKKFDEFSQMKEKLLSGGIISDKDFSGFSNFATEIEKLGAGLKNIGAGNIESRMNAIGTGFETLKKNLNSLNESKTDNTERQLTQAYERVERFQKKYQDVMHSLSRGEDVKPQAITEMVSEYKQLETLLGSIEKKQAKAGETTARKAESELATLNKVQSAYDRIDKYLQKNTRGTKTSEYAQLSQIRDELGKYLSGETFTGVNGNVMTSLKNADLSRLTTQASQLTTSLRQAGYEGDTLGQKIGKMYSKFGGWSIVTMSMLKLRQVMRDAVQDVIDIDTAMTELKRVTNESDNTYDKFLENASTRARSVGTSIKETVNATADFARLGYNIEDASQLADVAVMYKNVGDGIDDIGTATESIISTMKAFNMETSDSMHVVDAFDKTGEKHCPAA